MVEMRGACDAQEGLTSGLTGSIRLESDGPIKWRVCMREWAIQFA
jgi:hypothetical protein